MGLRGPKKGALNAGRPPGIPQRIIGARKASRMYTDEAIALLVDTMRGYQIYPVYRDAEGNELYNYKVPVPPKDRRSAAEYLIDRGWGKAPQAVTVQAHEGDDEEDGKLDEALEIAFVDVTPEEVQSVADSDTESLRLSVAK